MAYSLKRCLSKLFLSILVGGCASAPHRADIAEILPPLSESEYTSIITGATKKDEQYSGFYNTFHVYVTPLNSKIFGATLQRRGHYMGWDAKTAQESREKMFQGLSSESRFFMSFFAPDQKNDDFHRKKSIWNVILEYNGSRYPGKVSKTGLKDLEVKTLYPHHSRFSGAYEVVFDVPMNSVEQSKSRFILTSPLGTTTFDFEPVKN